MSLPADEEPAGFKVSESRTVQFPKVRHAEEIGWTPIDLWAAPVKRGGESGCFFRDELEAKLAEFNPWLNPEAVRSVMETLDALPATIDGNREMLAWLRGERQWHDEEEKRHRPVLLIDLAAAVAEPGGVREGRRAGSQTPAGRRPRMSGSRPKRKGSDLCPAQALRRRAQAWAVKLRVNLRLVRIQHMQHLWGSCTAAGTVAWAHGLLDAAPALQHYVIVHELLHLRVAGHGRLFKALLSAYVPNWRCLDKTTRPHST